MYVEVHFYNIQCDCCKALANEEPWSVDDEGAKGDHWKLSVSIMLALSA